MILWYTLNLTLIPCVQKHEFDDSLPRIYEEKLGKTFDDPEWINPGVFGRVEWEILKQVCKEMNPEEELNFEMMYSLIDVENRANTSNQRKGILDDLEKCITHTFYKNERDALQFYRNRLDRKKELGGKYYEKFFAETKDDVEEFEQEANEEDTDMIGDETE